MRSLVDAVSGRGVDELRCCGCRKGGGGGGGARSGGCLPSCFDSFAGTGGGCSCSSLASDFVEEGEEFVDGGDFVGDFVGDLEQKIESVG